MITYHLKNAARTVENDIEAEIEKQLCKRTRPMLDFECTIYYFNLPPVSLGWDLPYDCCIEKFQEG